MAGRRFYPAPDAGARNFGHSAQVENRAASRAAKHTAKHHIRNTDGVVPVRVGEGVVQVRVEPARVRTVVQVAAGKPSQ